MKLDNVRILERIIYDEQVREQARISRRFFPKRNQAGRKVDRVQKEADMNCHTCIEYHLVEINIIM